MAWRAFPPVVRAAAALAVAAPVHAADPRPATLVGTYDGRQMEIAAGLELRADGRFRYGLSYGALDEEAEGTWTVDGRQVLLTSDPLTPPRFALTEQGTGPAGQLGIALDLPEGLSPQYFQAEVEFADGRRTERQLTEEQAPILLDPGEQVVAVTLILPIYDLRSDTARLSGSKGHRLRFRFEPHDLGKVAFSRTALPIDQGDLILERHDRTIRFHRTAAVSPGN